MESSTVFRLSSVPPFLGVIPKPNNRKYIPSRPWPHRTSQSRRVVCSKMFVPGFGEASPEAMAAKNLHHFFTYIAVKIVAAQLQSYNPEAHQDLMEFLNTHSLSDGDKFCADLMRESSKHKSLALRILEVRSAYCSNDFEWDNLERLSMKYVHRLARARGQSPRAANFFGPYKMVKESNTQLMREYVQETSHVES